MSRKLRLSPAEHAILDLLTWRTRAATGEQFQVLLEAFGYPAEKCPGLVLRLRSAGLLLAARTVFSLVSVSRPLFSWTGVGNEPDCDALAWKLKRRFQAVKPRRQTVYWASPRAVRLVGGTGGFLRHSLQLEHDIATTTVFIRRVKIDTTTAASWFGEDILRYYYHDAFRGKLPDAALFNPDGSVSVVIECGGKYSAERLRRFHRFCIKESFRYELW